MPGPTGPTGPTGADGRDVGALYVYDNATDASGLVAGEFISNNLTFSSTTVLYVARTDAEAVDRTTWIADWASGGYLTVWNQTDRTKWVVFKITAAATLSTYVSVTCSYVSGSTSFTDGDQLNLAFNRLPDIAASNVTSGVFNIARLATGTPDGTKFVRDDGTLATPSGGGGIAEGFPLSPNLPTYTLPGFRFDTRKTQAWSGNRRLDYYPLHVTRPIKVDELQCYVSTAGAAGSLLLLGLYQANDAWQPTTRLEVSGSIAATSTGSKTYSFTERTLTEGKYLVALNINVDTATGPTMMGLSMHAPWLDGSGQYLSCQAIRVPSHDFTMPDPGTAWTSFDTSANSFFGAYGFVRVTGYA